jgi:hypothetical protein
MTPEDFGLTLEYPARPERGWKAIGDRRSLAVRARSVLRKWSLRGVLPAD